MTASKRIFWMELFDKTANLEDNIESANIVMITNVGRHWIDNLYLLLLVYVKN